MVEEKKDGKNNGNGFYFHLAVLTIVVIVVGFLVVTTMDSFIMKDYENKLKNIIHSKENVSDDYRKGWNDCIDELHEMRTRAINMTADMCIGV